MAKCLDCKKEMLKANTCTITKVEFPGGKVLKRNTSYFDVNERCHDCGIINKEGNYHHYGCDMERCPQCENQLIGCNCLGK